MAVTALKNFTFSLPPELVEKLKKHVDDFAIPSLNAAARDAFDAYVKELDRLKYRAAMQKAAADPDFRRDVEETMRDFARIDQLEESAL